VVSQVYADGWEATVDGEPANILATDHVLQGIPIDAGFHEVKLRYRPASLRLGLTISSVALVAGLSVCGWRTITLARRRYLAAGSRPRRAATLTATVSGSTRK
jgi:uncharacterized membrane protein YfhO